MRIIKSSKNIELELAHVSSSAFRINVRFVNEDNRNLDQHFLGIIYGSIVDEPTEDAKKYFWISFNLHEDIPVKLSDEQIKDILKAIRDNGLINLPAIMGTSIIPSYDNLKHRKSFQIGKVYYDDADPYPSLEDQLKK